MKKNLFIVAATALVFAGCTDKELRTDIQEEQLEIGFTTYSSVLTRGTVLDPADPSENNGLNLANPLENYNSTFKVWGSKYVNTDTTVMFNAQVVSYSTTGDKWEYSPIRFWDKSAKKYDFYAASPSGKDWVWDDEHKHLSLVDFPVSGTNRVTTAHGTGTAAFGVNASIAADAVMSYEGEDLMVSNDIDNYTNYTSDAVHLHFNHILSRLNIGVRKSNDLGGYTVKLKSLEVYNMVNKGTFNENNAAADPTGTIARWTQSTTATDKFFETPMSYTNTDGGLAISFTVDSAKYQYVYQGLVIPQAVGYDTTVLVKNYQENQTPAHFRIDGQDAKHAGTDSDSKPYIVIDYEIWTKDVAAVNYTKETAYDYNIANNLYNEGFVTEGQENGSGGTYTKETAYDQNEDFAKEGAAVAGTVKTPAIDAAKIDGYKYYYNLADVFNGNADTAVAFNEGWQNNLLITLAPTAINFDAEVFDWNDGTTTEVDIE